MKKVLLLAVLFTGIAMSKLYAQSDGLSPEGYKSWITAVTIMENATKETDYFDALSEFVKVKKSDPDYADTYYNLAALYTKIADMGGGVPMYNLAREAYRNYMKLVPSEEREMNRLLIELDVKEEIFLKRMNFNMISIDEGIYIVKGRGKEKGKDREIEVGAFAVQATSFTIADFKRWIDNPYSIRVAAYFNNKRYQIPIQESPTGNDNAIYISSFNTACDIIEVLNVITGRNYRLMTLPEWERLKYFKVIYDCSLPRSFKQLGFSFGYFPWSSNPSLLFPRSIIEWINEDHLTKDKKLCYIIQYPSGIIGENYFAPEEANSDYTIWGFRLVESF